MYTFDDLLEIMRRLRAPDGCPWDKEQDFKSLLPYLLEESAEYIDAALNEDFPHMCEELGDVLLQVVFHAQVAREEGHFAMADVIHSISEKMVRRHPHVFGDENAENSSDVLRRWEQIKATEKEQKSSSLLDGVPRSLCALQYAQKMQKKMEKVGFDWDDAQGAMAKLREEMQELEEVESGDQEHAQEELGDLLFSAVCVARKMGLDAELALRQANLKFAQRFQLMESYGSIENLNAPAWEERWQKAKAELRNSNQRKGNQDV